MKLVSPNTRKLCASIDLVAVFVTLRGRRFHIRVQVHASRRNKSSTSISDKEKEYQVPYIIHYSNAILNILTL